MNPTGAIFRISPDASVVQPVLFNMAAPNGISLTPESNALWVAESTRNTIVKISLMADGITLAPPGGVFYAYYGSGDGAPDSNKVDKAGNLYQAIIFQGIVLVLTRHGIAVAVVAMRGRDRGDNLRTNNLAFKPGTLEGYVTLSGDSGAWIFKFQGLEEGLTLYSHQ